MITATLVGRDRLIAKIDRLRPALRRELENEVQRLAFELSAKVKGGPLSGGVLNVKTGRLRRSITTRLESNPLSIIGVVGTNVDYGAFHEYGFKGSVNVRAHSRRTNGGVARVRAHSRRMDYAGKPFLKPSLEAMRERITDRLSAALNRAAGGVE